MAAPAPRVGQLLVEEIPIPALPLHGESLFSDTQEESEHEVSEHEDSIADDQRRKVNNATQTWDRSTATVETQTADDLVQHSATFETVVEPPPSASAAQTAGAAAAAAAASADTAPVFEYSPDEPTDDPKTIVRMVEALRDGRLAASDGTTDSVLARTRAYFFPGRHFLLVSPNDKHSKTRTALLISMLDAFGCTHEFVDRLNGSAEHTSIYCGPPSNCPACSVSVVSTRVMNKSEWRLKNKITTCWWARKGKHDNKNSHPVMLRQAVCDRDLVNWVLFQPPRVPTYTAEQVQWLESMPIGGDSFDSTGKVMVRLPCIRVARPSAERHVGELLLVYFHGNAHDLGDHHTREKMEWLAKEMDANVLCPELPGYGLLGHMRPCETSCKDLVRRVMSHVYMRKQPHQVVVIGRSLGAALAAYAATLNEFGEEASDASPAARLRGLVLHSPFSSVRDLAGDMVGILGLLVLERFDNKTALARINRHTRVLFFHGANDDLIAPYHSTVLWKASASRKLALTLDPTGTHNTYDRQLFAVCLRQLVSSSV